jgi:hypothetical protein
MDYYHGRVGNLIQKAGKSGDLPAFSFANYCRLLQLKIPFRVIAVHIKLSQCRRTIS